MSVQWYAFGFTVSLVFTWLLLAHTLHLITQEGRPTVESLYFLIAAIASIIESCWLFSQFFNVSANL